MQTPFTCAYRICASLKSLNSLCWSDVSDDKHKFKWCLPGLDWSAAVTGQEWGVIKTAMVADTNVEKYKHYTEGHCAMEGIKE